MNISITLLYILCVISILLEIFGFYIILSIKREIKSQRESKQQTNTIIVEPVVESIKHTELPIRILTATTKPALPDKIVVKTIDVADSKGVNSWELVVKGNGNPYFIIVEWSDGSHDVLTGKTPSITTIIHDKNLHPIRISNQSIPHFDLSYEWKLNGFHWA